MNWTNHVSKAVEELYPGTLRGFQFSWGVHPLSETQEPSMMAWDEDKLGPLDMAAIEARATEIAARPAPPLTKLAKATLWRRCTDEEAEALHLALSQAPSRFRLIFEAAQYLDTTDDDFPMLEAGVTQALGVERAAELLAPEF